ncbi:hypothetical protein EXIGLDRAFT_844151 [Exidia glandulosa HHB12029]|uniref:Uncharacterized protein n=1 Tax=Exidia glandulosa HHB12029 TaxID=1314781 RepID=A0A165ZEL0_EXIGL|nr:hypothetical protein EXIGLDRAFT_844151 [Exidia glandulosa HHB12029]
MDDTPLDPLDLHHEDLVGRFGLISINYEASVSGLRDAQATAEARALPRGRKYLAIIDQIHDGDYSLLYAVGQGPPTRDPQAMTLSIAPAVSNFSGRPPLEVHPPLPWPDCHIYTFHSFRATIYQMETSSLTGQRLTKEQQFRALEAVVDDSEAYGSRALAKLIQEGGDASSSHSSVLALSAHNGDGSNAPRDIMPDQPPLDAASALSYSSVPSWVPVEMRVLAQMWLDLSLADEIGSPDELVDALDELRKIEDRWAKREALKQLADQPATTMWAEAVATANRTSQESLRLPTSGPADAAVDGLVGPEDAIDERDADLDDAGREQKVCAGRTSPTRHVFQRMSNRRKGVDVADRWRSSTVAAARRVHTLVTGFRGFLRRTFFPTSSK